MGSSLQPLAGGAGPVHSSNSAQLSSAAAAAPPLAAPSRHRTVLALAQLCPQRPVQPSVAGEGQRCPQHARARGQWSHWLASLKRQLNMRFVYIITVLAF